MNEEDEDDEDEDDDDEDGRRIIPIALGLSAGGLKMGYFLGKVFVMIKVLISTYM